MDVAKNRAVLNYLTALCFYGTISLFLKYVDYSSEFVVLCRGLLGSLFIFLTISLRKGKIDVKAIRSNLALLSASELALGFNWVFLFAGYRRGVAVSSLVNYMAPIVVVVISSLIYKEKINGRQTMCIIAAFLGMLMLLGIIGGNVDVDVLCIVYGSLAALGFVVMLLCNRRLKDIDPLEKTLMQLLFSVLAVFPYVCIQSGFPSALDLRSTIIVLILGIFHTGVAYILYFSSIDILPAQSIAILGYLEPVLNLLIGSFFFKERIGLTGLLGALLIVLASVGNEVFADRSDAGESDKGMRQDRA